MYTDYNFDSVYSNQNFEIDSTDSHDYIRPEGSRYNNISNEISERDTLVLAHIFESCAIDPFKEDED